MEKNCFELLLAMMRLLQKEEKLELKIENAISDIIYFFENQMTSEQKDLIEKEFSDYYSEARKKRLRKDLYEKIKEKEYEEEIRLFDAEKIDFS